MSRRAELAATIGAGAAGAAIAAGTFGEGLLLIIPATLGVGMVALIADRTRRSLGRDEGERQEHAWNPRTPVGP